VGYSTGATLAATIVGAQLVASGQTSLQNFVSQLAAGGGAIGLAAFLWVFELACWEAAAFCLVGAAISAVSVSNIQR